MSLIEKIDFKDPDSELLSYASKLLHAGKIVAFPTDTCYGLAVDPRNPQAIEKLYLCKNRSKSKALPLLISNLSMLDNITSRITPLESRAILQFWPAPLTIIFEAHEGLPLNLRANQNRIAIRYPNAICPIALIKHFGGAITATSANISGDLVSPTTAKVISDRLGSKLSLILDGGDRNETSSTLIDLSDNYLNVLRQGAFVSEKLRQGLNLKGIRFTS